MGAVDGGSEQCIVALFLQKAKGVQGLIEVENPNRVVAKSKKISDLTLDNPSVAAAPAQLTRRER